MHGFYPIKMGVTKEKMKFIFFYFVSTDVLILICWRWIDAIMRQNLEYCIALPFDDCNPN